MSAGRPSRCSRDAIAALVHLARAGLARSSQKNACIYVRRMFNLAIERELLRDNPFRNVRFATDSLSQQRRDVQERSLSRPEVEQLIRAANEPYRVEQKVRRGSQRPVSYLENPPRYLRVFVLASLHTCVRRGELLGRREKDSATGKITEKPGLRWCDIHTTAGYMSVNGKTGPRDVPLTAELVREFDAYRRELIAAGILNEFVFVSDDGRPVKDPKKAFHAAVKRAGIGRHVRIHDLRHTGLTHYSVRGVPAAVVQAIAGHSSPQMTAKYVHIDRDRMIEEVQRVTSTQRSGTQTGTQS